MNPHEHDRIRRYLAGLPEPELPETAWPRLRRAKVLQCRVRRLAPLALASAAAASGVAFILALQAPPALPPAGETAAEVGHETAGSTLARLRAIDRALQAGYERGASEAELAPLWASRHALLAENHRATPAEPTRI